MLRRIRTALLPLALGLTLAACAGPMDRALDTGNGDAAYCQRLNPLFAQRASQQQEAYNWAVSDLTIAQIHQLYPDATPRQVIEGEVARVLEKNPARIVELQPALARHQAQQARLDKLVVSDVQFSIGKDFFGLQPTLQLQLDNGSDLSFSRTGWQASLYLDDATAPVATHAFSLDHTGHNGLRPGQQRRFTTTLGNLSGAADWITLEIQDATERRVVIERQSRDWLPGHRDLGGRSHHIGSPQAEIDRLQAVIDDARKWQQLP